MDVHILVNEESQIEHFEDVLRNSKLCFYLSPIPFMESLEKALPDAIIVSTSRDDVNCPDLLEAARAVVPGVAIIATDLKNDLNEVTELINRGRPDQVLEPGQPHKWHGQIARAIAQKNELKIALSENARLEDNNAKLEFHVRQFMMA